MGKIVGVGSLVVDVTAYAPHLPVPGETALGKEILFGPGGKGNNQMTAAHRLGQETVIVSGLGQDFLSDIMLQHYRKEQMSVRYIRRFEEGQTAAALIEVDTSTAQNRIVIVKGVCDQLTAADVKAAEEEFASCDIVLTQLETTMESVLAAKALAERYGKPFLLNPAPFQEVPAELFAGVDYVTPNETEASFFTGIEVTSFDTARLAAERFLSMGVKNVIITLGSQGAYFYNGTQEYRFPAFPIPAVDTTGAGDAFNGGLAAGLAEHRTVPDAIRFASAAAALSVTRKGTAPAMPRREETDRFLLECNSGRGAE